MIRSAASIDAMMPAAGPLLEKLPDLDNDLEQEAELGELRDRSAATSGHHETEGVHRRIARVIVEAQADSQQQIETLVQPP